MTPQPGEGQTSNQEPEGDDSASITVPRRTVLEAGVVGVPGWALDRGAYTRIATASSRPANVQNDPQTRRQNSADLWSLDAKLTPSETAPGERFGYAVAVDGSRALVGAESSSEAGGTAGAAYVFDLDTQTGEWRQTQKLTAEDANAEDRFGDAVALEADRALVGARGDDGQGADAGAAYVFERIEDGEWRQIQKLTAGDAHPDDRFGRAVALDGPRAIVGARRDDEAARDAGAAYVFELVDGEWQQTQKLTAADADPDDRFGRAIAVAGSRLLIGARIDDGQAPDAGAAYVFERDAEAGWQQTQKLTAADANRSDRFGSAVGLAGDRALVGAERDDEVAEDAGAAYVFVFDEGEWRQIQKLTADDGSAGARFGSAISLGRGSALVGAEHDTEHGADAGAAYAFTLEENRWRQREKLVASAPAPSDRFGSDVAIDGNRALVGASGSDERAPDAGSVYVYSQAAQDGLNEENTIAAGPGIETTVGILAGVVTIISGAVAAVRYFRDRETGPGS